MWGDTLPLMGPGSGSLSDAPLSTMAIPLSYLRERKGACMQSVPWRTVYSIEERGRTKASQAYHARESHFLHSCPCAHIAKAELNRQIFWIKSPAGQVQ